MATKQSTPTTIDDYIANYPPEIQALLEKMRAAIRKAAPKAEETINYGVPTFTLGGRNLVHFSATKKHIGFYPTPSAIVAFKDDLAGYAGAKGSVQFPYDQRLPVGLITRMVKFRVKEEVAKASGKRRK